MEARLMLVRVFVRDWERAVEFYTQTLGLRLALHNPKIGWAELDTGAAHLALERAIDEPGEANGVGRFVGVSLAVDDIYAVHEQLVARGVEFVEPPAVMPWGGVLAHFRDLEGNVLTLVDQPRPKAD